MKTNKNLAAGLLAAVLALGLLGAASAADDTMTLTLNITNTLAVQITEGIGGQVDRTNYDFGNMVLGDVSINPAANKIGINNTSGGLLQTYQLSVIDGGGSMVLRETSGALASNEYRLSALFQTAQPALADFCDTASATDDMITTSNKTAQVAGGSANFATASTDSAQDGVSVSDTSGNTELNLWLKLEAPPVGSSISGSQASFATVYVTAIGA